MTTDERIAQARIVAATLEAATSDTQQARLHFPECWRVHGHTSCRDRVAAETITALLSELDAARAEGRG